MPGETRSTFDEALSKSLEGLDEGQGSQSVEVEQPEAQAEAASVEAEQPTAAAEAAKPATAANRDATGKFTKTPAAPAPKEKAPVAPAQATDPKELRAPTSWAPVVREKWASLPREVRDQILKREGEVSRRINEASTAAKERDAWQQTLSPFMPHLQAQGVEPRAAVTQLLRTEYALRSGSPLERAQVVANLIRGYGVDVETLAATLEGKPAPQQAQQPAQFRDPRLDQLMGHLQQRTQQSRASAHAEASAQLEAFRGSAEFLEDVREDMADLMDAAERRGQPLTLSQAYDKACLLNDNVRTVLETRKAEAARQQQAQRAQRAQHAAGSVQSEPSPPGGGRKLSVDEALWAGLNGR